MLKSQQYNGHCEIGAQHISILYIYIYIYIGGILSPLLFNVYINDLSRSLSKLPIGCCSGENVINHLMYGDDIVLLSPSAKGMQRLLDNAYAYGCDYDILFNSKKSQLMIFDTMKLGYDRHIILGEAPLTVTNSYKYLGAYYYR